MQLALCKYCGNKGLFLKVSRDGLCKKCEPGVIFAVHRHVEIIKESDEIISKSNNFKTIMSRYDVIKDNILKLQEYETLGISVINQSTNELLKNNENDRWKAIEKEVDNLVTKHMDKATLAKTVSTKINNANKALLVIKEFDDKYGYRSEEKASKILFFINDSQLNDYIEKGDKEQFKGNNKKAINYYMEALFFISRNEVSNSNDIKKDIEGKMKLLKKD